MYSFQNCEDGYACEFLNYIIESLAYWLPLEHCLAAASYLKGWYFWEEEWPKQRYIGVLNNDYEIN